MDVYVLCDKCNTAKPESESSYYFDDYGLIAAICFSCQPTNG